VAQRARPLDRGRDSAAAGGVRDRRRKGRAGRAAARLRLSAPSLPDGWLDELAEFLRIPSISADRAHAPDIQRAAEWVVGAVERAGGEAEVLEDGRLVAGEIPASQGAADAPTVLVYGHYDVQPPDPLDLWETDPFEATPRGEWLYARGVADDKGQLWMQLQAAAQLARAGELPVNLRVACDGEEETGGDAIGRFVAADRPVDAAVILDGWMKRRNAPEFVVASRGLVALDVEVRTGARDLHSGHYGGTALNAIHALAQALTALFPRDGRLPEPLRHGIVKPSEEERAGWSELPAGPEELARVGAVPLDDRAPEDFYDRVFTEPSLDVNGILGGKPGLRNTTLVARATAELTIRIMPGQDPAEIAAAAERLLREAAPAGATVELRSEGTPAAVVGAGSEALRLARDAFERVFGRRPLVVRVGGTLPVLSSIAARGIPTVMAGLALPDSHTHSPNERMLLETFPLGVAAAAETYRALAALASGQSAR
jgi:acetylornithine deacetylase/succinyl-diaminopimelate desuccinylase-like protein